MPAKATKTKDQTMNNDNLGNLQENGKVYQEILNLAKLHNISLEATDFNLKAEAISRLSDNDILVNDATRALVGLRQAGILTPQQGYKLLGDLIEEMGIE